MTRFPSFQILFPQRIASMFSFLYRSRPYRLIVYRSVPNVPPKRFPPNPPYRTTSAYADLLPLYLIPIISVANAVTLPLLVQNGIVSVLTGRFPTIGIILRLPWYVVWTSSVLYVRSVAVFRRPFWLLYGERTRYNRAPTSSSVVVPRLSRRSAPPLVLIL